MVQTLPVVMNISPAENLNGYLQAVNSAPVLSAEEEYELASRYHNDEDLQAARTLVLSHLRHVVKVARGFMGYGLPLADLIQEGSIGLMKAVKRFDPERSIRLVTFATHWIRAEIYDYVIKNWKTVKIATTKAQRKLFFNLRKSRKSLGWMDDNDVAQLASKLDVDQKEVREMESRLSHPDISFDQPVGEDDEQAFSPSHHLGDERAEPVNVLMREQDSASMREGLSRAIADLDDRSKDIILRRWLSDNKPTLHELAEEYSVSAERIRQIEKQAMKKMRQAFPDMEFA